MPGRHVFSARAHTVLGITQGCPPQDVVAALVHRAAGASCGQGLCRDGLAGAHLSLVDALHASQLGQGTAVANRYADVWLETLVVRAGSQVSALLGPYLGVARDNETLAAAVVAFVEHHSAVAAGEVLGVHANTVSYRLERWAELTGHDVRRGESVLPAYVAARLALHPGS